MFLFIHFLSWLPHVPMIRKNGNFLQPPISSLMILKENLHSDGGDVLRTDTYVYDNNKLTTHTTLQEFYGQS